MIELPEATEETAIPVELISSASLETWIVDQNDAARSWVRDHGFKASPGSHLVIPGPDGKIGRIVAAIADNNPSIWDLAALPRALPDGLYEISSSDQVPEGAIKTLALGWVLGTYRFDTYKDQAYGNVRLKATGFNLEHVCVLADASALVRDLINTPANDMGPSHLAEAAGAIAEKFNADISVIVGDELLAENYPAIHAVGRAAENAPRLIEMTWGDATAPTVALVGKGVCFDTGGLDVKSAAGMKLMKKDMGGAAHVLGIAYAVMALGLNIHLKVLVPAVENAIAGNAMRPLDVVRTRAGKTIEIGHTDAEGRVILADALARAGELEPEMVIDFATLTGAARVALGTELPALFCNNDDLAHEALATGIDVEDPLWRMPLWPGYKKMVEGKSADLTNSPEGGYGGAITAALFLEHFAPSDAPWAHVDLMAWNLSSKAGRPEGGEAMGMRAIVELLKRRYG